MKVLGLVLVVVGVFLLGALTAAIGAWWGYVAVVVAFGIGILLVRWWKHEDMKERTREAIRDIKHD